MSPKFYPKDILRAKEVKFPVNRQELLDKYGRNITTIIIRYWRQFYDIGYFTGGEYKILPCQHKDVTTYIRKVVSATRWQPAEYGGYAICNNPKCGETLDLDDVPGDAKITERDYEPRG